MKRFYRTASAEPRDGGSFGVALDGRPIKTQGGRLQAVPTAALAQAMAQEWADQGDTIDPTRFVLRDMADYALDMVPETRDEIVAKLLRYAETDTLCYRADPDEPLWQRQRERWDPLVEALEQAEGIRLERVSGIVAKPHPRETYERLQARLEGLGDFDLAALEQLTALAASLCIGLAALDPAADGAALWDAANLEEDWQIEKWGADEEGAARRAQRLAAFLKAMDFARLGRTAQ